MKWSMRIVITLGISVVIAISLSMLPKMDLSSGLGSPYTLVQAIAAVSLRKIIWQIYLYKFHFSCEFAKWS